MHERADGVSRPGIRFSEQSLTLSVTPAGHSRPGKQQYAPVICWPRSRPQLNRSATDSAKLRFGDLKIPFGLPLRPRHIRLLNEPAMLGWLPNLLDDDDVPLA